MRRAARERGAAAVEFALVLPSFLMITGMMISLCIALYTRYELAYVATTAARTCVMASQPPNSRAAIENCARNQITQMLRTLNTACTSSPPAAVQSIQPGGEPNASPALYLLTVSLSCNYNVLPMVRAVAPGTLTTIQLNAQAAMPYLN
jgi:Flp pilus assembly protein TadG